MIQTLFGSLEQKEEKSFFDRMKQAVSRTRESLSERIEDIVSIALQEDVALVGLSILSGAHVALTTRTVEALRAADAGDIAVVVGGTIPQGDVPKLLEAGAAAVFPTGTPLEDLVREVRSLTGEPAPS